MIHTNVWRYYFAWCSVRTSLTVPPAHRLSGKELQLVVIEAEAVEGEEPSKSLRGQVVQGVVAKTKPLYVVQALEHRADPSQSAGLKDLVTITDV